MKARIEDLQFDIENIKSLLRADGDSDYQELLKGKRVAIAGPAETLIGTGQGSEIDTFDLVVRFNTVIGYLPFPDDLARDIGARTDLIYANSEILLDGIIDQHVVSHATFSEVCEKLAIKYIVGTNNNFNYEQPDLTRKSLMESENFRRFLQAREINVRFRMLFATSNLASNWLKGHIGRTGFIAILDLLSHDIKQLYVTGMTFYHRGGHLFLEDRAAELHPLGNHRGEIPRDGSLGHNSYLELELMRVFADSFGEKLKLDDRLQKLLERG